MKFCSECGSKVDRLVPAGDDRRRWVCPDCCTVHYQNPRVVAGCLIEQQGAVLLCRRSIEPRRGYWTLPAGFMELDETVQQGAARETWEEARARVDILGPYSLFNLPHVNQVYAIFRARFREPGFRPGPESEEVELFAADEIPWDELAFHTVRQTLRFWTEDLRGGVFPLRTGTIRPDRGSYRFMPEPDDQLG